jgi:tol-pal system protein YbgF
MRPSAAAILLAGWALCGSAVAQETQAAQTELRFQQLEDQVRNLTGQVETQNHQIEVLNQQLEKLRGDTELRLNDLEGKTGGAASPGVAGQAPVASVPQADAAPQAYPSPPPAYPAQQPAPGYGAPTPLYPGAVAQGQPGPGAPPRTLGTIPAGPVPSADPGAVVAASPETEYQAAYALVGQSQYGQAQQAFRAFLAQYPASPLASSAAYWVGHTYYAQGDFQNAAVAFADGYKKYPKGIKAPDTLLDLGRSLARLDQVPGACATFAQFDKQFGVGASPAIKKQEQQEKARLKCG